MSVNWERTQVLRDHIAALPERNFNMGSWLMLDRYEETVAEARNPECGTVGCIAGWASLLFSRPTVMASDIAFSPKDRAKRQLSLTKDEADHMFLGGFADTIKADDYGELVEPCDWLTRTDVLRYLDKAIAAKDIMVTL